MNVTSLTYLVSVAEWSGGGFGNAMIIAHYRFSIDQVAVVEGNRMCTERDGSRYHFRRPIDSASIAPDRVVHTLRGLNGRAHKQ